MSRRFLIRQSAGLVLTANALRPVPGMPTAIPAFFAGWLTGELAPQVAALTVADAAVHVARHGSGSRSDRAGLAAAGLSLAGLAAVIEAGRGSAAEVEDALTEALGPDYRDRTTDSAASSAGVGWRRLLYPFRIRHPDVRRLRNLAYAEGGRRFRMDIFHHRGTPAGAPVLLQLHGGGWVTSNKDYQALPLMVEMASRGWVCATVNYPLSPRAVWPEHLIAVKHAIAWLREHVADYGGDPEFIAVTGGSAGGHLAAMAALTAGRAELQPGFEEVDTSVAACVPHYGVYDFAGETGIHAVDQRVASRLMQWVLGKQAKYPQDYLAASPYASVRADAPPFFVVHGSNDSLVPVAEARAFVTKLRSVSDNPVAYVELRGAQHAFDVFPSIRSAYVLQGVARFLDWAHRSRGEPDADSAKRASAARAG